MKIIILTIILLSHSCGSSSPRRNGGTMQSMGVDIQTSDRIDDRLLPDIEKNQNKNNSVGPFPKNTNDVYLLNKKKNNKLVVGLALGPGINRVLCHIPILKELETQGQPIHIITGTGLGAVVASLYASGISPDKIEWIFYKFSKKVTGIRPYSKVWIDSAKEILLKNLESKTIQSTTIRLAIPKYIKSKKKVQYMTRGKITDVLIEEHLGFNTGNSSSGLAPFQKEVFNQEAMIKLGADKTIAVDVLDNKIEFETTDHYLTGVFGRITGIIMKEKESIDLFVTMNSQKMPLDSTKLLPSYLQKCMIKSRDVIQNIKSTLEQSEKN